MNNTVTISLERYEELLAKEFLANSIMLIDTVSCKSTVIDTVKFLQDNYIETENNLKEYHSRETSKS